MARTVVPISEQRCAVRWWRRDAPHAGADMMHDVEGVRCVGQVTAISLLDVQRVVSAWTGHRPTE